MARSKIALYEAQLEKEAAMERRERILSEATEELRTKLEWIQSWFETEWRRAILVRYDLAVQGQEVYEHVHEPRGRRAASGAVDARAQYFGWDEGFIYDCLRVARAFTRE